MGLRAFLRSDPLGVAESRSLSPSNVPSAMLPHSRRALLNVNEANVLGVTDAFAAIKVLSDAVCALPPKVYRKTVTGRVPAGDEQRLVQLLRRPAPGATSADLFGTAMVHLLINGNCFIAKYLSEGSIVSLGLLDPSQVEVELRGSRVVYRVGQTDGVKEVGPESVLHVKGLSSDGVRGVSPVSRARVALSLGSSLQESARQYLEEGSHPSGILSMGSPDGALPVEDALGRLSEQWKSEHAGVERMHKVAVLSGDVKFTPLAFSAADAEFLGQRELSTREICRIFGVPPHLVGASAGDNLTYTNASQFNRYFLDYSLMPWLRRLELAFSNDTDLCPGGAYLQFDLRGFLRPDPATRSEIYQRGLDPLSGWLSRSEVRELEDLEAEGGT